jgi:hypothetical protein
MIERLKLLAGMLLATVTATMAIWGCFYLVDEPVEWTFAAALFLGYRVIAFMANKQLPLTSENVRFMSSERVLWNLTTIIILVIACALKWLEPFIRALFSG